MLRHSYAELESVRLHYAAEGPEDGDLILFAHGFPEFWYAWKKQLAEFGRSRLAVAPDLRGYNLSSKPGSVEDYELRHLVEDIRGLAAHFGCGGDKKFTLVGHDWGGVVAWAFALVYPDWLERLVVINAPHLAVFRRELAQNPAQRKASEYIQIFRTPVAETAISAGNYRGAFLDRARARPRTRIFHRSGSPRVSRSLVAARGADRRAQLLSRSSACLG